MLAAHVVSQFARDGGGVSVTGFRPVPNECHDDFAGDRDDDLSFSSPQKTRLNLWLAMCPVKHV
jgi:hypothetical protein